MIERQVIEYEQPKQGIVRLAFSNGCASSRDAGLHFLMDASSPAIYMVRRLANMRRRLAF
jgi:hypothetical protein